VLVGKANSPIPAGGLIATTNVKHAVNDFQTRERKLSWKAPDVSKYRDKTFMGYHRADGSVAQLIIG
jgi:altronate hydrolase